MLPAQTMRDVVASFAARGREFDMNAPQTGVVARRSTWREAAAELTAAIDAATAGQETM